MKKERHFIYLETDTHGKLSWSWIEQFKHDRGLKSRGEALEELFQEYALLKAQAES